MKLRIQDLEAFERLSEKDKTSFLRNYKKGSHFLLFYGRLFGIPMLLLIFYYIGNLLTDFGIPLKIAILAIMGSAVSTIIKLFEINVVAKKIIKDWTKDHS